MAFAPVNTPQFPNVPKSPGAPPVLRRAGAIENTVVAVASDAIQVVKQLLGLGPQWGIYDKTNRPLLQADSVISVDYRQEWAIATYPIEQGAFNTYNKVKSPFDVRVMFAVAGNQGLLQSLIPGGALLSGLGVIGGSSDTRKQTLTQLDQAISKRDLVKVITPEATYDSVNIMHYDYRREARSGVSIIRVEVWLQEVRVTAKAALTDGKKTGTEPIAGDKSATPGGSGGDQGSSGQGSGTGGGTDQQGGGGQSSNGGADAPKNPESRAPSDGGSPQPKQVTGPDGSTTATKGGTATGGLPGGSATSGNFGQAPAVDVFTQGANPFGAAPPGKVPLYDTDGLFTGNYVVPGSPVPPGYYAPIPNPSH